MQDSYVEILIKRENSGLQSVLKVVFIVMTILLLSLSILGGGLICLIAAIIVGVLAYMANLNAQLEFEYLYVDKELSIDKIMAQTKRKRVGTYDIGRMEVFAPEGSYHLDAYKKQNAKLLDYSSGKKDRTDKPYMMVYSEDNTIFHILLEPDKTLIDCLRTVAPRKVFKD